jgi:hypothetical protein
VNGDAGFTLIAEQSGQIIEADVGLAVDPPLIRPAVVEANEALLGRDTISEDGVTTSNPARGMEQAAGIRVKHVVVPIDPEDGRTGVAEGEDEVIEPKRPSVLSEVPGILRCLCPSQNRGPFIDGIGTGVFTTRFIIERLGGVIQINGPGVINSLNNDRTGDQLMGPGMTDTAARVSLIKRDAT